MRTRRRVRFCSSRWKYPSGLDRADELWLEWSGNDPRHHVVVVGFGDLCAVKAAGFEGGHIRAQVGEVVDVNFAVDLRGVELGAAFPQQRGLFALALGKDDQLAADPLLLGALAAAS